MNTLRRTAIVAGCALSLVAVLESVRWLRSLALSEARESATFARMNDQGVVTLETIEWVQNDGSRGWSKLRHVYDESGRPFWSQPATPKLDRLLGPLGPAAQDIVGRPSNPWVASVSLAQRLLVQSATASTVSALEFAEGWRNGYSADDAGPRMRGDRRWPNWDAFPRVWSFEDGRFLCRALDGGEVLAGFGPDGYVAGPSGGAGERFSHDIQSPTGPNAFSEYLGAAQVGVLLDSAAKRVYFLRVDWPPFPPPPRVPRNAPILVHVTGVSVAGPAGEPPTLAYDGDEGWMWRFNTEHPAAPAVPLRAGPELLIVRSSGTIQRIRLGDVERDLILTGDASCIATVLAPVGAPVAHLRVRRILDGGKILTADVDTVPVTTSGRIAAAGVGAVSWLRPPLLNAVSFAAPRVTNYADYFGRFFTDGVIAGSDGAGWFAGSLAIGALCAAFVRRQALRRAPHLAARWTAIGAALGPLAFIWMSIAMPKSHVPACPCGRRRAVHVETCPACASPWPAPAATGIEVFA